MKIKILIISLIMIPGLLLAQNASKKDIKAVCTEFEQTILNKNLDASLKFFEPEYKQMQHDRFLEGNTTQFVREFLAGATKGKALYRTPEIAEIESIKLKKIKFTTDHEAEATLFIKLKDGAKLRSQVLIIIKSDKEIYFVGAVG